MMSIFVKLKINLKKLKKSVDERNLIWYIISALQKKRMIFENWAKRRFNLS
jgi:hypothetical protein